MRGNPGWLDMSRYPEPGPAADPDEALPAWALGRLRDILLGHEVTPPAGVAWPAADLDS